MQGVNILSIAFIRVLHRLIAYTLDRTSMRVGENLGVALQLCTFTDSNETSIPVGMKVLIVLEMFPFFSSGSYYVISYYIRKIV